MLTTAGNATLLGSISYLLAFAVGFDTVSSLFLPRRTRSVLCLTKSRRFARERTSPRFPHSLPLIFSGGPVQRFLRTDPLRLGELHVVKPACIGSNRQCMVDFKPYLFGQARRLVHCDVMEIR